MTGGCFALGCPVFRKVLGEFSQCLDTLGAQNTRSQHAVFHDLHLLQVRLKSPSRPFLRVAFIAPKLGMFFTMLTLSHVDNLSLGYSRIMLP
jgi:hypothetical protein